MRFDYAIGNPPYQQDSNGANESDTPLYHYLYDEASKVAYAVELITPARFLFNAGYTPKAWNEKMLNDEHFKVLLYEPKSNKFFANTDIKGGVAIGYRDINKKYNCIGVFTVYPELNDIKAKVDAISTRSLCEIITNRGLYRYSDAAYREQPDEMNKTADARIAPSAFERMPLLFTDNKPNDNHEYIQIYGNIKSERFCKWFRKDYVKAVDNLSKYKVMVPKANGSGAFGEVLSNPIIGEPLLGFNVGMSEEYYCSDMAEIHKELLREAVADSRNKAELIASFTGQKITGIKSVITNYAEYEMELMRKRDQELGIHKIGESHIARADMISSPTTDQEESVEVNLLKMKEHISTKKMRIRVPYIPDYNTNRNVEKSVKWVRNNLGIEAEQFRYFVTSNKE